ncbi:MAG TPA: RimK/LysX family protein [Porticoccaceae bacterium]|nr:RimK/LysX family protein [Porticoccaceae bacterium]
MVAMRWLARICGALAPLVIAPLVIAPHAVAAAQAGPGKVVAGRVESIYLSAAPSHKVTAKLDSGARTSSIDARNIEPFTRDGKPWVRFELMLGEAPGNQRKKRLVVPLERPVIRYVRIKEHDGSHSRRPIVELEFCFDRRLHHSEFSLVDRSQFLYPVLFGRRFLAGVALIDSAATFLTEPDCPSSAKRVSQP